MKQPADLIIENASELVTCDGPPEGRRGRALRDLQVIRDGAVAIAEGRILAVGTTAEVIERFDAPERLDATGRLVSPGLIDPHSHLVYAGSRHDEWEFKVTGRQVGAGLQGGIHRSVAWTRAASDEDLTAQALRDLDIIAAHGTTTLEAKTGYGLDRESELRLLRLTAGLTHAVEVIPTFLGAHVPPVESLRDTDAYVELVIDMMPEAAELAEFCDICCDPIGFTRAQCRPMAERARALGMGLRIHSDQTGDAEGGLLAAETGAVSADHGDYTSDRGFQAMAAAGTAAVFLPGVAFHMLEMTPAVRDGALQPADKPFLPLAVRRAIDTGCVVALSADYNPGSCPCPSMQMVMQLAARLFRLGYAEIWHMCTLNAAASLRRGHDRGSLTAGKRADIVIWSEPEHGMIINRFGYNMVDTVLIGGQVFGAS